MATTDMTKTALLELAAYSLSAFNDLSELTIGEVEQLEHMFRVESLDRRLKAGQGYDYSGVFDDGPLASSSMENTVDTNYTERF